MDEHDKRAREVLDANEGNIDVSFDGVAILADALRSTAAAAVAAERERCVRAVREVAAEYREDAAACTSDGSHALSRADGCDGAALRISQGASPAQAERASEDEIARVRRERDDALEERDTREDIITAALVDCLGLDPDDDLVSGIRDEQRGHRTEVERLTRERDAAAAETASRIAARLRARADECVSRAERLEDTMPHVADVNHAIAAALRAEADALEVGT